MAGWTGWGACRLGFRGPRSGGLDAREGHNRDAVGEGWGDGTQGLPRASANPGLRDATPLAFGGRGRSDSPPKPVGLG